MRKTAPSLLLTTLLLVALVPTGTVAAAPSEASEFYYGVEYDWSSVDSDLNNLTGLDIPEILGEVMGAADDAGFNLVVGQLLTGSSNVYVHHTENIAPQTIQNLDGEDISVWSRTDDVTLRHGVLADGVFMTDWLEPASFGGSDTSFDIDASSSGSQVLTVDMSYTEYLDDNYNLIGADMLFAMEVSLTNAIELDAMFEGGGEEVSIDFDTGISLSYGITESSSQWRLGSPSPIYVEMSGNDYTDWMCANEWELDDVGVNDNEVVDDCGQLTGTYTGALDYSFSLTGIPTEELGLDAGELDIELSDSVTESGTFDETVEDVSTEFSMGSDLTVDLGDGAGLTTTVAACETCPPGNPLMFLMMGSVLAGASASFAEEVAEDVAEELSEDILGIFGGGDDDGDDYDPYENQWQCDSGDQWIDEWAVNNGYEDCYDGSDEMDMSGSWSAYGETMYMIVDIDDEMLSFNDEGATFTCDDGTEIGWSSLRDYSNDCANNEDEDAGHSETDTWTCNDGTTISWNQINDYVANCASAEDEGATAHYTVEGVLMSQDGTPLSQHQGTFCDAYGCDQTMDWFYGEMSFDTGIASPASYGSHEYCTSGSVTDTSTGDIVMEFSSMCSEEWNGPSIGYTHANTDGMNINFDVTVYDWSEKGNATLSVSVVDENGNQVFLDSMAIDGSENEYHMEEDVSVLEEGEYCLHAELTETGQSEPYDAHSDCFNLEEGAEPSDELIAVVEAFMDSDLSSVMEDFGMNLQDRLADVAPSEFPYNDGMWAPMWSSEHAAMVGVGAYAMDDDGAYIMAGPATEGYSDDAPAKVSIRYLTGAPASVAAEEAETATTIDDIVDTEEHDLAQITEDLEDAGVDTTELDLPVDGTDAGDSDDETPPQTAEELAEDAGLLPALSPLSVLAVISLAGVFIGRRNDA